MFKIKLLIKKKYLMTVIRLSNKESNEVTGFLKFFHVFLAFFLLILIKK